MSTEERAEVKDGGVTSPEASAMSDPQAAPQPEVTSSEVVANGEKSSPTSDGEKPAEPEVEKQNDSKAADSSAPSGDAAKPEPEVVVTPPTATPRVVIVTGASSGLGLAVSRMLCAGKHDVIMACRSEQKAIRAIAKIRKHVPDADPTFMQLDLADLESVRSFVSSFRASGKKLSVLVNNAGVILGLKQTHPQLTKDNFELTMATNHLGHFLLTNLLLSDLKAMAADGGDARIVVVTSAFHDPDRKKDGAGLQALDVDDLFLFKENAYSALQAYKNSKLANLMLTYELSRQLAGTGVKVNAVDPGFMPSSELLRHSGVVQKLFARVIQHGLLRFTKQTRTCSHAAVDVCNLAIDDSFKEASGKYFQNGHESKSSEESLDEEKQKAVWQLSGGYTRLDGFEPLTASPPQPPPAEPKVEPPAETTAAADLANGVTADNEANAKNEQAQSEAKTEAKPVETAPANDQPEQPVANDAASSDAIATDKPEAVVAVVVENGEKAIEEKPESDATTVAPAEKKIEETEPSTKTPEAEVKEAPSGNEVDQGEKIPSEAKEET